MLGIWTNGYSSLALSSPLEKGNIAVDQTEKETTHWNVTKLAGMNEEFSLSQPLQIDSGHYSY